MLTGDNGITSNASKSSTANAYYGAEEQVKLAYGAVKTEIMAQTVKNGTYDATTANNTKKLAQIVEKDLSGNKWFIDGTEAGVIKIRYKDTAIDQGAVDSTSNPKVPRQEGKVDYTITLQVQNATLQEDVEEIEDLNESVGNTPVEEQGGAEPTESNLTTDELAGLSNNGITEIAKNDITNNAIKSNDNIRAVITGEVPIPNGFYYVGGTKDDGVVISDNVADSGKGTSHSVAQTLIGNQFVWVPVEDSAKFVRSDWINWSGSGEPSTVESDYKEDASYDHTGKYQNMFDSVISNKGFFVARYEASQGINGYESKQGKTVWTYIAWGDSYWEVGTSGAVYQAISKYTENEYGVTSTLIYGIEWDAILRWMSLDNSLKGYITNSCGIGNYSDGIDVEQNSVALTGSSSSYVIKNIYDLAGNVKELTMETYNDGDYYNKTPRGGYFETSGLSEPVSRRTYTGWNAENCVYGGFRTALYL